MTTNVRLLLRHSRPLGWLPQEHKWKYMNDVAMSFVEAVATTLAERDIFHAPH